MAENQNWDQLLANWNPYGDYDPTNISEGAASDEVLRRMQLQLYPSYLTGVMGALNEGYQPYEQDRIANYTPEQLSAFSGITGRDYSYDEDGNIQSSASDAYEGLPDYTDFGEDVSQRQHAIATQLSEQNPINPLEQISPNQVDETQINTGELMSQYGGLGTERFPDNAQEYMDPYKQNVIDSIEDDIDRDRKKRLNEIDAQAAKSGAWGSRRDILTAETNKDFDDRLTDTRAKLLDQGYTRAADIFSDDRSRALQGGIQSLNTAAGLEQGNMGAANNMARFNEKNYLDSAFKNIGMDFERQNANRKNQTNSARIGSNIYNNAWNTGTGTTDYSLGRSNALYGIGSLMQGQNQQHLDLAYQDFSQQRDYPLKQAQTLGSAIQQSPFNTASPYSKPTRPDTGTNWGQWAGLGISGAGLALDNWDTISGFFADGGEVSMASGGDPEAEYLKQVPDELLAREMQQPSGEVSPVKVQKEIRDRKMMRAQKSIPTNEITKAGQMGPQMNDLDRLMNEIEAELMD